MDTRDWVRRAAAARVRTWAARGTAPVGPNPVPTFVTATCGETPMSKAQADPAELRRFAADLNRFNTELTGLFQSINSKLRGLEQTWRDAEQRKFTEAFDQTAKGIGVFIDNSVQHVQMLNKKAALLEEYLKQR
jgi:uncharacterized protein YukE